RPADVHGYLIVPNGRDRDQSRQREDRTLRFHDPDTVLPLIPRVQRLGSAGIEKRRSTARPRQPRLMHVAEQPESRPAPPQRRLRYRSIPARGDVQVAVEQPQRRERRIGIQRVPIHRICRVLLGGEGPPVNFDSLPPCGHHRRTLPHSTRAEELEGVRGERAQEPGENVEIMVPRNRYGADARFGQLSQPLLEWAPRHGAPSPALDDVSADGDQVHTLADRQLDHPQPPPPFRGTALRHVRGNPRRTLTEVNVTRAQDPQGAALQRADRGRKTAGTNVGHLERYRSVPERQYGGRSETGPGVASGADRGSSVCPACVGSSPVRRGSTGAPS